MIRIKLRKSKIILEGLPGLGTYDREAVAFVEAGTDKQGHALMSIRNVWENKYVVYRRRISEVVDEGGAPFIATGDQADGRPADGRPIADAIDQLNALVNQINDLPAGGTAGQLLLKASDEDYQTYWSSLPDLTLHFENKLK